MLTLSNVTYRYHQETFLFDARVKEGSITALIGPSGAGKSTLLALLGGFIWPDSGDIQVFGESVLSKEAYARPFSMLFQDNNLFSHLTVQENIGLGLDPGLRLTSQQREQIQSAAHQVGIGEYLQRKPDQLSGGQRQRVALARCFVQARPIWLLDEPFSALDPVLREEMLLLVKRLAQEKNSTVLMVTHHIHDARAIADDFLFLNEGKVEVADSIAQLHVGHANPRLSAFVQAAEPA